MMTKTPPLMALALAGLAASAHAQPRSPLQPDSPPIQTRNFVQAAGESDSYEIMAGRTAATQSQNPAVRAFAEGMVRDHTETSAALTQATTRSGVKPPPMGLGAEQSPLLNALQSLKGPEFDRAYMRQQVVAHHQALVVQQTYAAKGADPNVRQAAAAAVPLIQHHLEMAEQLSASLGVG